MTEKFIINQNGEIEDTMAHINFDSFMEILIVLNGQSRQLKKLSEENEQLKKELFESKKDYIIETYSDNPTRRDEKIQGLKEEFKERFGDLE